MNEIWVAFWKTTLAWIESYMVVFGSWEIRRKKNDKENDFIYIYKPNRMGRSDRRLVTFSFSCYFPSFFTLSSIFPLLPLHSSSFSLTVKPGKNSVFLENGKTVISIENQKFSRSRMTKRIAPLNSSHKI